MSKPKLKQHLITPDWCKCCGLFVAFCPKNVLSNEDSDKVITVRADDSICCKLCELRCPDLAIEIITQDDK